MIEVVGFGKPGRLLVGGLHGREGLITESILGGVSRKVELASRGDDGRMKGNISVGTSIGTDIVKTSVEAIIESVNRLYRM